MHSAVILSRTDISSVISPKYSGLMERGERVFYSVPRQIYVLVLAAELEIASEFLVHRHKMLVDERERNKKLYLPAVFVNMFFRFEEFIAVRNVNSVRCVRSLF